MASKQGFNIQRVLRFIVINFPVVVTEGKNVSILIIVIVMIFILFTLATHFVIFVFIISMIYPHFVAVFRAQSVSAGMPFSLDRSRNMAAGYRIFNVVLARRIQVSPSLLRCVFTGPEVAQMKHESPDQRIKLLFAEDGEDTASMAVSDTWYQDYLALPKAKRPVMRTYTLRELRVDAQEVDVEFVLHGDGGPASRWATHARPGDALQMVAPNGASDENSGGYEWLDNDSVRQALLIADETALPAAMGILEQLAKKTNPPRVQAFFTVPHEADFQLQDFPFADVHWLARDRQDDLLSVVEREVTIPAYALAREQSTEEDSLDGELLWERAREAAGFQAWVAAESTLVKNLRRSLIEKQQLNRDCASFMAYWAQGRA